MASNIEIKAREIFKRVIDIPADQQRNKIEELCGNDSDLEERVYKLIDVLREANDNNFLDTPTVDASIHSKTKATQIYNPGQQESHLLQELDIPKQIGKYLLLEKIGQGGMGVVYRGKHIEIDNLNVALKIPMQMGDKRDLKRNELLKKEANALANLRHHHIVHIQDIEQINDIPVLVMEFLEGKSLTDYIEDGRIFQQSHVIQWGIQIADALEHMHSKGVYHRDIKSSNIILNNQQEAILTDFGLALPDNLDTVTLGMFGTLPYMSPEQVSKGSITPQSDIYSLGITLYECMTGRLPFMGASIGELTTKITQEKPPSITSLRPETDPAFAKIIQKCLAKKPSGRFESPDSLKQALLELNTGKVKPKRPILTGLLATISAVLIAIVILWFTSTQKNDPSSRPSCHYHDIAGV